MKKIFMSIVCFSVIFSTKIKAQEDFIRGGNHQFRNFWNVKKYEINVEPNAQEKTLTGTNNILFSIVSDKKNPVFQIDLQQPMQYKITHASFPIKKAERKGNFIYITSSKPLKKGTNGNITIDFFGKPKIAKNAPWDGGWVFSKDSNGKPFIGVAQEGIGVSMWLPTKDIWEDEPENGIITKIKTTKDLVGIGNGRLKSKKTTDNSIIWEWEVKNTINPYSIAPSVGDYISFKDTFQGEGGTLDLEYWVLRENENKARRQFQQVKPMLSYLEYWLGKYPFYEDGYKLVETPFLGMEHQSNVAYGNGYQNGYMGRDLSQTGVGLKWDFIIIHETAHEWFANNITAKDKADMWIHEAFTSYAETLYTEKLLDKNEAEKYVIGTRKLIQNDSPMEGKHGFWKSGSGDMYFKGANMVHTLRQMIHNDTKFREILRKMNAKYYHSTVSGKEIETFWEKETGQDLKAFFQQYIRTTNIPIFEYKQNGNLIKYRLTNAVENLQMPIYTENGNVLYPTTSEWRETTLDIGSEFIPNANYLIEYKRVE